MKILLFVSMLVMAPLGFTQAYGGGEGGGGSSGGGYGGGGGAAIAGLLLVGGLVYFLTRDTEEEETNELTRQSSEKSNRFEFNFERNNLDDVSNTFQSTNFESPQNDLKFSIKYNLN